MTDTGELIRTVEETLDRIMPDEVVPRPRWFAFRNEAGYSDREIAIANSGFRRGAQFVLREVKMAELLSARGKGQL